MSPVRPLRFPVAADSRWRPSTPRSCSGSIRVDTQDLHYDQRQERPRRRPRRLLPVADDRLLSHGDATRTGRCPVCMSFVAGSPPTFLSFSRSRGNDLSTPVPEYDFPGLKPVIAGAYAPLGGRRPWRPVSRGGETRSTHISALEFCSLDDLMAHAIDRPATK